VAVIGSVEPRHLDRRKAVKAMLIAALCDVDVKMVASGKYSSTGLDLSERFTSYLEVLHAFNTLPWHEQRVVLLSCCGGPDRMTQETIARKMGWRRRQTAADNLRRALDRMIDIIYDVEA